MDKIKIGGGTLEHHLSVLDREGVVKSHPNGRFKRYSLHPIWTNKSHAEVQEIIERADESMRAKISMLIRKKGGITQREICKILGSSKQIISYHIQKLETEGKIRTEKYGLTKRCYYVRKSQ